MKNRFQWVEYEGENILICDFVDLSEKDFMDAIEEYQKIVLEKPPGSVLRSVNLAHGTRVTPTISKKWHEFNENTKHYKMITAIVGVGALTKSIIRLTRNDIYPADTLEEAKDWLVKQI